MDDMLVDLSSPKGSQPMERAMGRVEAQLDALKDRQQLHEASMAVRLGTIDTKLEQIGTLISETLGGWRGVRLVGGALIAVVSSIVAFMAGHTHLFGF